MLLWSRKRTQILQKKRMRFYTRQIFWILIYSQNRLYVSKNRHVKYSVIRTYSNTGDLMVSIFPKLLLAISFWTRFVDITIFLLFLFINTFWRNRFPLWLFYQLLWNFQWLKMEFFSRRLLLLFFAMTSSKFCGATCPYIWA